MIEKELIDKAIGHIARGTYASSKFSTSDRTKILGDLLHNILDIMLKETHEDEETFKYVLNQIILKCPFAINEMSGIVQEKFPDHKEYIDKLIILK